MKIYVISESGYDHKLIIACGIGPDDADMDAYLKEFEQLYKYNPIDECDIDDYDEIDKENGLVLEALIKDGLLPENYNKPLFAMDFLRAFAVWLNKNKLFTLTPHVDFGYCNKY